MEYHASPQTDDNESIRTVCLRDRQHLPITNPHNVCFGKSQQLPAHHYNVGAVTSKQSRCATFKQYVISLDLTVGWSDYSATITEYLDKLGFHTTDERKLKVNDNVVLISDRKQDNCGDKDIMQFAQSGPFQPSRNSCALALHSDVEREFSTTYYATPSSKTNNTCPQ
jgi:hypothetical protein